MSPSFASTSTGTCTRCTSWTGGLFFTILNSAGAGETNCTCNIRWARSLIATILYPADARTRILITKPTTTGRVRSARCEKGPHHHSKADKDSISNT